jgi:hypothetical protein
MQRNNAPVRHFTQSAANPAFSIVQNAAHHRLDVLRTVFRNHCLDALNGHAVRTDLRAEIAWEAIQARENNYDNGNR